MKNIGKNALKGVSLLALLMLALAGKTAFSMDRLAIEGSMMTDDQVGDMLARRWENYEIGSSRAALEKSEEERNFEQIDRMLADIERDRRREKDLAQHKALLKKQAQEAKAKEEAGKVEAVEVVSHAVVQQPVKKDDAHASTFLGSFNLGKTLGLREFNASGGLFDVGFKHLKAGLQKNYDYANYTLEAEKGSSCRCFLSYKGTRVGALYCETKNTGNKVKRTISSIYLDWEFRNELNPVIYIEKCIAQARAEGVNELVISQNVLDSSVIQKIKNQIRSLGFKEGSVPREGSQSMSMKLEPFVPAPDVIDESYRSLDFMEKDPETGGEFAVGRVHYRDSRASDGGIRRYVSTLDVFDGYRDKGYGTRHMRAFIEQARKDGVTEIALYALSRPVPFYRKLGLRGIEDQVFSMFIAPRKSQLTTKKFPDVEFSKSLIIPIDSAEKNEELKGLFCITPGLGAINKHEKAFENDNDALKYNDDMAPFIESINENKARELQSNQSKAYAQAYTQLQESADYKELFDQTIQESVRSIARDLQNAKVAQTLACSNPLMVGYLDGIIISPTTMPRLYAYVAALSQEHGLDTPTIIVARNESYLKSMSRRDLVASRVIVIAQSLLQELPDVELEALIAHQIGRLKYEHAAKIFFMNTAIIVGSTANNFISAISHQNAVNMGNGSIINPVLAIALRVPKQLLISHSLDQIVVNYKNQEKGADRFVCEIGKGPALMRALKHMQAESNKEAADLDAVKKSITNEKSTLSTFAHARLVAYHSMVQTVRDIGRAYASLCNSGWLGYGSSVEDRIAFIKQCLNENLERNVMKK